MKHQNQLEPYHNIVYCFLAILCKAFYSVACFLCLLSFSFFSGPDWSSCSSSSQKQSSKEEEEEEE
jgi:hypothetical protein